MRNHFMIPECTIEKFIDDLKADPFRADKEYPTKTIEELGKQYPAGYNRVSTNDFCFDIEKKAMKLKDKEMILSELKKTIIKKNTTIEKVFA